MSSSVQKPKTHVKAEKVWFEGEFICLKLADGREVKTPLERYPKLKCASPSERHQFQLNQSGTGILWPSLDEDLTVDGIVHGR